MTTMILPFKTEVLSTPCALVADLDHPVEDVEIQDILQPDKTKLVQVYEPPHDKTNKMTMRPAKTQISLGGCPG